MTLDIDLKPTERLLFSGESIAAGTFRCKATDPIFFDSGPCNSNVIVFPRTVVEITHRGGASFIGEPTVVALYNEGQRYRRRAISPADNSDWIAVADRLLEDVSIASGRRKPTNPFSITHLASTPSLYLAQRVLFERLAHRSELDSLDCEERALAIVTSVLGQMGSGQWRSRGPADGKVEAAKELIASRLRSNLKLREISSTVGSSAFHLCRTFKKKTGMTLTEFRNDLRLRTALQMLARREADILDIALNLGFSSHSHFTLLFRRNFGMTPSAYRQSIGRLRPRLTSGP